MKLFLTLLVGASLAALPVAHAGADDPLPAPCDKVFATDKAGDQEIGPVLGGPPGSAANTKAPDNMDIRRVFFNTVGGVTTANIEVTKLDKTVPAEIREGRFSYVVDFATVGDVSFVRAEVSSSAVTFHAATVTSAGPAATVTGQRDLKGKFLEGPNGIVQIELPADVFKPGVKLENAFAYVSGRTDNNNYTGYINDQAPDDGATAAKTHTIAECPAPAPSADPVMPAPEAPAPEAPAPPQQTPGSTQPAQPAQPHQGEPAKPKAKKKPTCQQKAKKLKGKKRAKALKACKKKGKKRR